jgi:hypothetical protein
MDNQTYHKITTVAHNSTYIYWRKEAEYIKVTMEELDMIAEHVKKIGHPINKVIKGRPKSTGSSAGEVKTKRILWMKDYAYRFDDGPNNKRIALFLSRFQDGMWRYYVYYTEKDQEKLNRTKGAGLAGFEYLSSQFLTRTHYTISEAFGSIKLAGKFSIDNSTILDKCVESTAYAIWLDIGKRGQILDHLYKADIKSSWPSQMVKELPNLHTAVKVAGVVKPTAEYPVVFYLKSGHIAELGKYDTHELKDSYWYHKILKMKRDRCLLRGEECISYSQVPDSEEISLCMKYSTFSLEPEIMELFAIKEDKTNKQRSTEAKLELNALIGFMRSNAFNFTYMGHISAVVYARATKFMVDLASHLVEEGNIPLYFAIDSIMWTGHSFSEAVHKKDAKLGDFVYEVEDEKGVYTAQGNYFIVDKAGEVILEKHQGTEDDKYKTYNIKTPEQFVQKMKNAKVRVWDSVNHKSIYVEDI